MRPMRSEETLAENYRLFALERGLTMAEVAERSGGRISLRHIQRLANCGGGVSLEKLDALAFVFGVPSWMLLVPGLKPTAFRGRDYADMIEAYNRADPESRALIAALIRKTSTQPG